MSRIENIKVMVEIDVFCANDKLPPAHLVSRYIRDKMPRLCTKGDLDALDTYKAEKEYGRCIDRGDLDGALEAFKQQDGWDDYTVHFNSNIKVLEA